MTRDEILNLVSGICEECEGKEISCQGYLGTQGYGEGWLLMQAPSRDALIRLFHERRIPYLVITEVWKLDKDAFERTRANWEEVKVA